MGRLVAGLSRRRLGLISSLVCVRFGMNRVTSLLPANCLCKKKVYPKRNRASVQLPQALHEYALILCILELRWTQFELTDLCSSVNSHITGFFFLSLCTEQSSSWEAIRSSASEEIPRILWYPQVHYRIPNSVIHKKQQILLPAPDPGGSAV